MKVLTGRMLLAAVAIVVALGVVASLVGKDVSTVSGQHTQALVQGGYSGWMALSHDDSWYVDSAGGEVTIQTRDPEDDAPPYGNFARFTVYHEDLCTKYDCSAWPAGTTNHATTVDGVSAVKYILPTDGTSGDIYYAVNGTDRKIAFALNVITAPDASTYASWMAELELIIASIDFIPNYVDVSGWTMYSNTTTPVVTALAWFELLHPPTWLVLQTPTQVIVTASATTVSTSVTFEPSASWAIWDNATPILGAANVRFLSTQTSGGFRTTTYIKDSPILPIKVIVVVPDGASGTTTYWTNEQTAWAIMEHASLTYSDDGYPAP